MTSANPNASQVRVGVRIRPLSSKEKSEGGGKEVVESNAFDRTVTLSKRKFTYDSVFHPNVSQPDLYANIAPPLLHAFCNGYNATVIAYGQTGAGKTYTMGSEAGGNFDQMRNGNLGDEEGLIPRFMSDMFASLIERREASEKALLQSRNGNNGSSHLMSLVDFKVAASFLEVYGEDIFDLLDGDRNALKIREDSNKEVIVVGLKSSPINNAADAMSVLNTGTMNRTTAETLMNFTSSRSHAVFTVNLQQTTRSDDGDELSTSSRFTFVDLAGSERMKKTGAEGERAKEGIKINEGLLALGNVINALADEDRLAKGEKVHVPYRQSKLTRLLQDALGGNSQTLFLACVSPSDTNASETLSTLHYANRARNIKNAPTRNVDATAEELRRLRTLTNLLKCELVKQRFDVGQSSTAIDPEVERANESAVNPQEIGVVNEELLQRDDVVAYMKQIDDKATELNGSIPNPTIDFPAAPSTFALPRSMPQSVLGTPPRSQQFLSPRETSSYDDDDDSHLSVNPDEDIQVIDDLLQHEDEQISKIEGDIEEQEDRLLQIKEHLLVYQEVKQKYDSLASEVQKLESEKQTLQEKLERAEKGEGCSLSIKTKLEQVKASLARARQDVRKQQQKCREAEQEAQRCKGLERKIEELKSAKATLIRKQRDDAKKQKDITKTKSREIQEARKRERSAQKKLLQVEAENARYKTNLERSKTRYEKLSAKLKQTESDLKKAHARKRSSSTVGTRRDVEMDADGLGQFAPASAKISSVKFVLDKTVSDRVKLSQNRLVYKSKVEQRENLLRSMATEVKLLNELKRDCKSKDSEPSSEILAEVKDREDNVQDLLIQTEIVENGLEELQAKYPSIEDDNDDEEIASNVFDENEPALKMISKLNGPVLRTLMLDFLGSCYASELDRQGLKDELAMKDYTMSTLEDEVGSQVEKIKILSGSLARHEEKIKALGIKHQEEVQQITKKLKEAHAAELASIQKDTAEKVSSSQSETIEKLRSGMESSSAEAVEQAKEELSASHALELEKMRSELQSSASLDLQNAQAAAEEKHKAEIESITSKLKEAHAAEVKRVREDTAEMAAGSRSEALEKLRTEMEESSSKAVEQAKEELSASHALELEKMRSELQSSASIELQNAQAAAEEKHKAEIESITNNLKEAHSTELSQVKSEMSKLTNSHRDELNHVKSKMEDLSSQLFTKQNQLELIKEKLNLSVSNEDSLQRELAGTKKALSIYEKKVKESEHRIAELLSQQRELESIEHQINSCVSNKDTLLRELEKTSLLKELEKAKQALSLSEEKNKRSERQLARWPSIKEQLQSIKEQLNSHETENATLSKELEETKKALSISKEKHAIAEKQLAQVHYVQEEESVEMKRDEAFANPRQKATPQAPYEKKTPPRSPRDTSLVIDTSGVETLASPELVGTPSSVRSSSSAVLPTYSKFDSLKQRYRKKAREPPKTPDA